MLLYGWIYFHLLRWMARVQIDQARERRVRRTRQRRQQVGQEPILKPRGDMRAEEERLLSILRERRSKEAR